MLPVVVLDSDTDFVGTDGLDWGVDATDFLDLGPLGGGCGAAACGGGGGSSLPSLVLLLRSWFSSCCDKLPMEDLEATEMFCDFPPAPTTFPPDFVMLKPGSLPSLDT